jgi:type IV pilus assembly protein PilY1
MLTANPPRRALRRSMARVLAWILVLGQLALPMSTFAQTVPPALADQPIAAKVSAKPNIVYTLDDSGSMQYNFLPDYVVSNSNVSAAISSLTRSGTTATATVPSTAALSTGDYVTIAGATQPEYNGVFAITIIDATHFSYVISGAPVTPATGAKTFTTGSTYCRAGNNIGPCTQTLQQNLNYTSPPFFASSFNRLTYNPNVTYLPPVKADGTPFTVAGSTDANGNYAYTAALWGSASVQRDAYGAMFATATKDNLSAKVSVPLYCNTTWPLDTTYGDANGEYLAGAGAWCRINGTAYDASALSGAPAVADDYNYPYSPTTGTGAQYFYLQLGAKILYCDQTSPYYPRNATITSCNGGTPVYSAAQAQVCKQGGKICNPLPALRNFNQAGCTASMSAAQASAWCKPNTGGSDGASPGIGEVPECSACTCKADTDNPNGNCRLASTGTGGSGAGCSGPFDTPGVCPDWGSTITSCTGGTPVYGLASATCNTVIWDPATNAPDVSGTRMVDDSNGNGYVCRHNNQTYAVGGVAGLFKFPVPGAGDLTQVYAANQALGQLGKFTTAISSGCPAVGTTVAIPRHYYTVDSVQFCDQRITAANDQWRGFGTGVCQAKNDLTHYQNVKYGKFTRYGLYASSPKAFPSGRTWLAAVSPGPDNSESINYANWYAYYATRLNAAKTTSGIAFANLTNVPPDPVSYRVGFHNLGDEPVDQGGTDAPIKWVDVADWDLTQRTAWYSALYGIKVTNFKTPIMSAMVRIGNLFERGSSSGLDTTVVNPLPAAAADPIALSCQSNYHILFTDGMTQQVGVPSTGDLDQNIPAALTTVPTNPPDQVMPTLSLGGSWPKPFQQGTPAVADTLSDIATYYWATDLRDAGNPRSKNDMKNNVPAWSGKGTGDIDYSVDISKPLLKDVAWWQHLNFSAISFGAEGLLDANNRQATLDALQAGTISWPDLTKPNDPPRKGGAAAVDDLWHATLMGRGSFVNAHDPIEVAMGIANILAGIQNQPAARAAAAFGSQVLDSSHNIVYKVSIQPGWSGDLQKVEIDPTTGAEVKTWWQGSSTLAAQLTPSGPGDEPWMDETRRRIVTLGVATNTVGTVSGPGVPFRYDNLTASQLASLAANATAQQNVIAYLRGGATNGGVAIEGTAFGQFRKRFGALGDINNSGAAIVGPPSRGYKDATDPGYSGYVSAHSARSTQVVVGANDGMVHVFNAGPVNPAATGGGDEAFAYVPKALFRGVAGSKATEDASALQALTYQDGGVPIFHHHMYVDATPRVADVDFNNGGGSPAWHTIAVGGLGKGGNTYYALDLTDPTATTEDDAAAKVLWEWTDPTGDLRYSYARPVIVKLRESGYPSGRWVALVTGGYNNVSGKGKIYVLDAHTGTLLRTFTTTAGTAANPSGLAQIHAFVKDRTNQIAEQIYGGDLLGNLWRIDVSKVDDYKTAVPVLFAQLTDPGGNPQPMTTAPQIEIDVNNGIDRYVFIGTGRLLDATDFTDPAVPQQQTMYAIRDGTLAAPETAGLPIQPRVTMVPVNADKVSAIVGGAPNGWYDDLPAAPNERVVVDVQADVNIVNYVGTQAQDDPCSIALPANLYARDFTTAKSLLLQAGVTVASVYLPDGGVGTINVGRIQPDGSQSLAVLVSAGDPSKPIKPVDVQNPVTGPGSRLSWRLLTGE